MKGEQAIRKSERVISMLSLKACLSVLIFFINIVASRAKAKREKKEKRPPLG